MDVLYHCLLEDPENSNGANMGFILPELWKDSGVSLVYCLPSSNYQGIAEGNHLHDLVSVDSVDRLSKMIEVEMVDYQFYNEVSSRVNCKPNTGIVALMHLLGCQPKLMKVFGFSFLLDGWYGEYRSGYEEFSHTINKPKTYEQHAKDCLESKRHNQETQWKLCKEYLYQNPNVDLDPILYKILSMNTFDKKHYDLMMERYYDEKNN